MIEASNTPKFQKRRSILAPPHLPQAFNLFVSALIVTHIFLSLIGQPIDYWIDFSQATSVSPLDRSLLAIHPLLFVALGLILLFFNNWLLPKLNRYVGLILWTPLCYLYIYHALSHISYDLDRLIPRIQAISFFVNIISFIVFSGIAGLLVTKMFSTSKNENVEVEKSQYYVQRQ